ncbi:MAG: transcriptional regulator [Rhizobiaceae bacterium MnEN-MB40S]|nr:MAG: transcriptional regulator [Rhizobiaceae bacterium MnEN-MB40S]
MRMFQTFRYIDTVARVGSIRSAAEALSITSSALNRRILAFEEELGEPIFERLPRGVRLNAAGEILINHIRNQIFDLERVRSQISDLTGIRRGNVNVACSQALVPYFLPRQISIYRDEHPGVTFGVYVRDRRTAEEALMDYSVDLALVFEPVRFADFQTILRIKQPVHAVMRAGHPLASHKVLRLRDCTAWPLALPTAPYGVRALLEAGTERSTLKAQPSIESDSFEFLRSFARVSSGIGLQIPIGLPTDSLDNDLVHRPIDTRDIPAGMIYMGHLRGRTLPVAAARFVDQLSNAFSENYETE